MSDPPDLTPRHPGNALLVAVSMAQFMVVLDFTIVNVALPSIQQGMHIATSTVQWVVSGYAVAFEASCCSVDGLLICSAERGSTASASPCLS
jgi:MFS family permease